MDSAYFKLTKEIFKMNYMLLKQQVLIALMVVFVVSFNVQAGDKETLWVISSNPFNFFELIRNPSTGSDVTIKAE